MRAAITGLARLQQNLKATRKDEKKALDTAIRVEGFRLRKTLIREIRQGAPGGVALAPLSAIARRFSRSSKPLRSLSRGVRYQVTRNPFSMSIGFSGSKSWARIALKMQEGAEFPVSGSLRRFLARIGGNLGKRSAARKYFFLEKETATFKTPARPIIAPFWAAHKLAAEKNIARNWKLKIKGVRI